MERGHDAFLRKTKMDSAPFIKMIFAMVVAFLLCVTIGTKSEAAQIKTSKLYLANDLRYLTAIIYCEARGESYEGQKAVGIVVLNRVESDLFPDDVEDVIYQSGQFSPVDNGSLYVALSMYDNARKNGEWDKSMLSCFQAAEEVLEGSREIKVGDEVQSFEDYLFFSRYIGDARFVLGNHMFR